MRNSNRSMKVSTLAFGIIAALAATQAMASGFQIREDSVQAMSRSHAGTASAPGDAAVVYNNPAAMALFDKTTVQSDLNVIDLSGQFTGGGHDALGHPLSGGDGGDAGSTAPVPAFHAIFPFHNNFTMGVSLTAPFGLKTQYDPGWVGRYQALTSDVKTFDFTVSAAYRFNDQFSLGLGLITERIDAKLTSAVDLGAVLTPAGYPAFQPQSADGMAKISGNDTSFGWVGGLLWQPGANTNIGLIYRSRIDHDIDGKADFTVPANAAAAFAGAGLPLFLDTGAHTSVSTPSIVTFSITQKLSDTFSLDADISRTNWSSLKNLVVTFDNPAQPPSAEAFNWDDSMNYALGMDWKFDPSWVLRAGIGRDQTPTNDADRDPRLPDQNRWVYSIGFGWTPNANASWNFGYSRIDLDTPTVNNVSATGSTLVGKYSANANIFGVSGTFTF